MCVGELIKTLSRVVYTTRLLVSEFSRSYMQADYVKCLHFGLAQRRRLAHGDMMLMSWHQVGTTRTWQGVPFFGCQYGFLHIEASLILAGVCVCVHLCGVLPGSPLDAQGNLRVLLLFKTCTPAILE